MDPSLKEAILGDSFRSADKTNDRLNTTITGETYITKRPSAGENGKEEGKVKEKGRRKGGERRETRTRTTNRASKGAIGAQEVLLGPLFERSNTRRHL